MANIKIRSTTLICNKSITQKFIWRIILSSWISSNLRISTYKVRTTQWTHKLMTNPLTIIASLTANWPKYCLDILQIQIQSPNTFWVFQSEFIFLNEYNEYIIYPKTCALKNCGFFQRPHYWHLTTIYYITKNVHY